MLFSQHIHIDTHTHTYPLPLVFVAFSQPRQPTGFILAWVTGTRIPTAGNTNRRKWKNQLKKL